MNTTVTSQRTVLMVGPHLSFNLGGPSIVLGIVRALGEQLEGYRFVLAGYPPDEQAERLAAERYGIQFVPIPRGRLNMLCTLPCAVIAATTGRLWAGSSGMRRFLHAVRTADVVVAAMGIMFADSLRRNTFTRRALEGQMFGVAKAFGKPTAQYTADFGPLQAAQNRSLAKFWLGRYVDAILCRSWTSHQWLTEIGIPRDKLQVAPDTGFFMEPVHTHATRRIMNGSPARSVVGVGVSHQVRRRFDNPADYDFLIRSLVRHAARERGHRVLVVPNEILPGRLDDQTIAEGIVREEADSRVSVVNAKELSGPELKAIIGQCDLLVSSRYHSLVAGLSMEVPCLALGWHHKYRELFRLFEMDEWALDYAHCGPSDLRDAFDRLWAQRGVLRRKIAAHLPNVESAISRTAAAVAKRLLPELSKADPQRRRRGFGRSASLAGSVEEQT